MHTFIKRLYLADVHEYNNNKNNHTNIDIHMYVYIYIYMCVCVCTSIHANMNNIIIFFKEGGVPKSSALSYPTDAQRKPNFHFLLRLVLHGSSPGSDLQTASGRPQWPLTQTPRHRAPFPCESDNLGGSQVWGSKA